MLAINTQSSKGSKYSLLQFKQPMSQLSHKVSKQPNKNLGKRNSLALVIAAQNYWPWFQSWEKSLPRI